jgi:multidrug efflux pump subunit AcrB
MKYAVRVQVDPTILAARGVAINEVEAAIKQHNVNMPSGTLSGVRQAYTVQANGQLTEAEGYRELIVTYRNGAPLHLGELGQVIDSVQDNKSAAWYNSATHSRMWPVIEVARTLKSRLGNILTYLKHRITNTTSESVNTKIQWVKYTARGFRNKHNFKTAIYFHRGGLDMSPLST